MTRYRAILLGGVCLGLLAPQVLADDAAKETPAWAAEATMNPDYKPADDSAPPASQEATEASEAAAPAAAAETETPAEVPAWAAEATMNPDYKPLDDAAAGAEAPAAAEPAAAEAEEAPTGETGNGDTSGSGTPAWAAEATMNPDYEAAKKAAEEEAAKKAAEKAAEEEAAKKAAEEEAAKKAAEEEAARKAAEEEAAKKAAEEAAAKKAAEEEAARQAAIASCRDALNGVTSTGNVQFGFNRWVIKTSSLLDKIAEIAKGCPANTTIEVGGHTDNSGSAESNQKLSELRAQAVMSYLVKAGVDAAKLKAIGYGQDKPVADNNTAAGRAENRRIEFSVSSN